MTRPQAAREARGAAREAPERPHSDLGLQPERTSLSWQRTLLALLVVSAMLFRWIGRYGVIVLPATGVLVLLAALILLTQRRRYLRFSAGLRAERLTANVGSVVAVTAAVLICGVVAAIFVILDAI
ncbi:DUF202 domain-containing protein [uncultured Corynebacterium sp.]|uniref:DUF202 domain-containing protein n=1 Tax=uncultured Corynebacterium sp. TaxID=159447 RepID=UPI0025FCDA90|nr:DUF202 domain-containing protein [uncultured Corynebacterium sp.]